MLCEEMFHDIVTDIRVIAHTERVVAMCCDFAECMDLSEADTCCLIDSAWIHDVAKLQYGEEHNRPENIMSVLNGAGYEIPGARILEIIANHKDGFTPGDDVALLSAILRICDKLDKFNKKSADAYTKTKLAIELAKGALPEKEYVEIKAVCDKHIAKYID